MKTSMTILRMGAGAAAIALLAGCASTGIQRTDVNRERPLTTKFEADDARITVEKMVDSMMSYGPVVQMTTAGRPVLDVAYLQNRTMQQIDTVSLTDSMRTRLLRSGKFRFKDRSTSSTDLQIINEENEAGLVNKNNALKPGAQIATELYLYGAIMEMFTEQGRTKERYYKITMNLKDLKSGEIIWTDEQEIRKVHKKTILGL